MSIFRRRLMMTGKEPIEYLEFEDRRVWEICAYLWGDTYNIQEVNGAGGVLGSGELEGNNDTLVYSDYMFAATYAIGAHGTVPATAARTVQYRVEIVVEGGRALDGENAPWDIATASAVGNAIFYTVQYGTTMSATALGTITAENWADPTFWASQTILTDGGAVGANARKYTAFITTTNACQYLRLGIRAVAGTNISWKFVSVGVTKLPQGITQAQCTAVSSLGTVFQRNSLIRVFNELAFFTGMSNLATQCFRYSSIAEATLPTSLRKVTGRLTFANCANLKRLEVLEGMTEQNASQWIWESGKTGMILILPSTLISMAGDTLSTHGSANTTTVICKAVTPPTKATTSYYNNVAAVYVPDESVDTYKAAAGWSQLATKIKPLSEYVN